MNAPCLCMLGQPRLRWEATERVVVGRPGRALIGLAVRPEGVTLDELADIVWAGEPPRTARSALHVHLGTLRRLFDEAPPGLGIARLGERYVLERDGWDLDTELVRELVDKARELLAVDNAEAAVTALTDALAMWRGTPFNVGADDIAPTLSYQWSLTRLDVEEQLAEALLEAGEAARAEHLAEQLVDAEPYRERRWGQLMRALVMQHRSADALRAFERARSRLRDDLGVAPGDELVRLEHVVLTHNRLPDDPWPAAPGDTADIPASIGEIVGRDTTVQHVEATLGRLVPVLLAGAPGSGKTRIAIEVANRALERGEAVRWVDLRNAAFDQRVLGDGVTNWARQRANGLVVLDNAEHAVGAVAQLVARCRRSAPTVRVLVTSRVPVPDGFAIVTVDPLSVPPDGDEEHAELTSAVRMLRALLELLAPGVDLSTDSASALVRQLGGLPLAIRLAADLARSVPVAAIAAVTRSRLGADLTSAVGALLEHLGPDETDAFSALSVVAGQLDGALVNSLTGGDQADASVTRLVDHGLVQFTPSIIAAYSVPEPLRDVGAARLDARARRAVLDRLTDACLDRVMPRRLPTSTTASGDRLEDELRRELPWYRQALDHLIAVGDDSRALRMVAAVDLQLYSLGWWEENIELQDLALSIPGRPSGPRARVHAIRGRPGQFHQFVEEHNQIAVDMATDVGDIRALARGYYHLGVMRWWSGLYDEALGHFAAAKGCAEDAGDVFMIGEATRFTGMALVSAGEWERGLATQLALVERAERVPDLDVLLPHLLMHLGHSRRHVGDPDAALADLTRARDGFEQVGNHSSLVHVCTGLAEVLADGERFDDALDAAARALDASGGGHLRVYEPWTLCIVARVHANTGNTELARRAAAEAIESLARTYHGETHRVALELASVASTLGEHRAALRLAGLATATPDRRELPFRSPFERRRLDHAVATARRALGAEADEIEAAGARSSIAEAAAPLIHAR